MARGIRGYLGRIGRSCRDAGGSGRRGDGAGRLGLDIVRRSPGICSGDSAGAGLGLCLPCLGWDAGREPAPGLVPVLPGLLLLRCSCRALPAWVQLPPALGLRLCCYALRRCCCFAGSAAAGPPRYASGRCCSADRRRVSCYAGKIQGARVLYAGWQN